MTLGPLRSQPKRSPLMANCGRRTDPGGGDRRPGDRRRRHDSASAEPDRRPALAGLRGVAGSLTAVCPTPDAGMGRGHRQWLRPRRAGSAQWPRSRSSSGSRSRGRWSSCRRGPGRRLGAAGAGDLSAGAPADRDRPGHPSQRRRAHRSTADGGHRAAGDAPGGSGGGRPGGGSCPSRPVIVGCDAMPRNRTRERCAPDLGWPG